MRQLANFLTVALLASACGGAAAVATTSPLDAATTSTSAAVRATTTMTDSEPRDVCGRGLRLEIGDVYRADCLVVPVQASVAEDGWVSEEAVDERWSLRWRESNETEFLVRAAVIAFRASDPTSEVLEAIVGIDGIEALTDVSPVAVAGAEGLVLDVEAPPNPSPIAGESECPADGPIRFEPAVGGVGIVDWDVVIGGTSHALGVAFCQIARVWAVQVGEQTITVIGGTTDPTRHEDAVAKLDALLDGLVFDTAGS